MTEVPAAGPAARPADEARWAQILAANPVFADPKFNNSLARWTALRDAGEAAGLTGDDLAKFIAHGMGYPPASK